LAPSPSIYLPDPPACLISARSGPELDLLLTNPIDTALLLVYQSTLRCIHNSTLVCPFHDLTTASAMLRAFLITVSYLHISPCLSFRNVSYPSRMLEREDARRVGSEPTELTMLFYDGKTCCYFPHGAHNDTYVPSD
jgi:hypothetical protein